MTWLLCDAPVRFSTLLGMLPCAMVAERFAERFVEQLRLFRRTICGTAQVVPWNVSPVVSRET